METPILLSTPIFSRVTILPGLKLRWYNHTLNGVLGEESWYRRLFLSPFPWVIGFLQETESVLVKCDSLEETLNVSNKANKNAFQSW